RATCCARHTRRWTPAARRGPTGRRSAPTDADPNLPGPARGRRKPSPGPLRLPARLPPERPRSRPVRGARRAPAPGGPHAHRLQPPRPRAGDGGGHRREADAAARARDRLGPEGGGVLALPAGRALLAGACPPPPVAGAQGEAWPAARG